MDRVDRQIRGTRVNGGADLPTPEDLAAEMSRQTAGANTAVLRESLIGTARRALDAIGALREKSVTRATVSRTATCPDASGKRCAEREGSAT